MSLFNTAMFVRSYVGLIVAPARVFRLKRRIPNGQARYERILELSRNPVIIGGCGRSGTSLLLAVLSCHPRLMAIAGETNAYCAYVQHNPNPPIRMDYILRDLMNEEIPASCVRICEKTPKNVRAFGSIINQTSGRARIIHIVRDGRSVVTSRHPESSKHRSYHVTPGRWVADVSAGLDYQGNPCVMLLKYEDLLLNFTDSMRKICEFIGEPWAQEFEEFPKTSKIKQHSAWSGSLGLIDHSKIFQWKDKKHEGRIKEFNETPGAIDLMARLGYI